MSANIKVRWKKPSIENIIAQTEAKQMSVLASGKVMANEIVRKSIGTQYFSLAALKALKHPYSLRGSGRPGGIPAGVVNRQSGRFAKSLFVRGPYKTSYRIALQVMQTGDAQDIGALLARGSSRMQGRPWQAYLKRELHRLISPYIKNGLAQTLKVKVKSYG